jgi:hypothetical protein
MPDIYDIDFEIQEENLNVPTKRKPKTTAFLNALMYPLQWIRDLLFEDYVNGAIYPPWGGFQLHPVGERVTWEDKSNYECIVQNFGFTGMEPSGGVDSAIYWIKIQDNFMGANQRARFNSQIIILEHALNKWFRVPTIDPQIYLGNNYNPNTFLLGTSGIYSSPLASNSAFTVAYLGNAPTFTATDFTVYVPVVLFATLGNTVQNRENNVRRFVDKYRLAGIAYNVTTY